MHDLRERLQRWIQAGLLTPEQADAIDAFERHAAGPASRRTDRRTLGAEAVGYVGAALAIGAITLLLGELWNDLLVGGRLALVAVLTLLLGGGGVALRRAASSPMQRLTSVLFTGAVIGVGWLAFIVSDDLAGLREVDASLAVGLATFAAALPVYLVRRRALPQLTLLVTVLITVGALFARVPLTPEPFWTGVTFWALGIGWLLLGTGGWLAPRRPAEIAGGVVGLLAVQVASFDDARLAALLLAVVTAGALVGLAIASDRVHHLAVGAVGLFVLMPQLVFEVFGDAIGAPATLLVVGLLLVVLAVGLGRARREVTGPPHDGPAPTHDGPASLHDGPVPTHDGPALPGERPRSGAERR